jgi:hypothetical protein
MKRNLRLLAVGILAASIAAMVGGTAWQALAGPIMANKLVPWRDANSPLSPGDTTFLTDEADTTRTQAIDTYDWDWAAIGQANGGVATGAWAARVYFTAPVSNGVTDTVYFTIEQSAGGGAGGIGSAVSDTIFSYNPAGQIGSGTLLYALPQGTGNSGALGVWSALLPVDPDTPGNSNIWLVPRFRLRVFGDVSGTTPKNSGLRCTIVYPKRQEAP